MRELQLCLFLKPAYSCSARERERWGASERPAAVTARLPVVGGEEEDKERETQQQHPMRPKGPHRGVVGLIDTCCMPVYW